MDAFDAEIRQVLSAEVHAVKPSVRLWDDIEARLDREPLRVVPRFRFPVERAWRTAVAVSAVAAAAWLIVVPDRLMAGSHLPAPVVAKVSPVVLPVDKPIVSQPQGQQTTLQLIRSTGPIDRMD